MKAFFDTSVLVAAFSEDHIHHQASFSRLSEHSPLTGCCGAHSLIEVYATLTRMPGRPRVNGNQANLLIKSVRERLTVVALDVNEYVSVLEASAARHIAGGSIYDAVLAQCALKANAETIYTWNLRHFLLMGDEVVKRARNP